MSAMNNARPSLRNVPGNTTAASIMSPVTAAVMRNARCTEAVVYALTISATSVPNATESTMKAMKLTNALSLRWMTKMEPMDTTRKPMSTTKGRSATKAIALAGMQKAITAFTTSPHRTVKPMSALYARSESSVPSKLLSRSAFASLLSISAMESSFLEMGRCV